ncbi:hypothetical protein L0F63_000971, partial [Massospora cicadina]
HPLALLNITDHFTRVRVQAASQTELLRVIGVLLGTQAGRKVSICNSFEVKVTLLPREGTSQGRPGLAVDEAYLASKQEHIKQVFPTLDAIGWYALGAEPTAVELELQEKYFQPRIDLPLFLQFDARALLKREPYGRPSLKNRTGLPLAVYEPFYDVERTSFIEVPDYSVETEPTQRLALAALAQAEGATMANSAPLEVGDALPAHVAQDSPVLLHLSRQHATARSPSDHTLLREINSLASQLPCLPGEAAQDQPSDTSNLLYREFNDILLGSYLSSLTRCSSHLLDLMASYDASQSTALRARAQQLESQYHHSKEYHFKGRRARH